MKRASNDQADWFSARIKGLEDREEIVIAKAGVPVARVVPIDDGKKRELGYDEGLPFRIADDFDAFVPEGFDIG